MYNYMSNVLVTVSTSLMILSWGQLKHSPLSHIFTFIKKYLFSFKMYIKTMNDELSDDMRKTFILPLTIEI